MSNQVRFQSKSTKYYVTSTKDDKDGHDITTVNGDFQVPADTVRAPSVSFSSSNLIIFFGQILTLVPGKVLGTVYIVGVAGLHVYLDVSLHLYILLGDLFLSSGLERSKGHQAHLVQEGIRLANRRDS